MTAEEMEVEVPVETSEKLTPYVPGPNAVDITPNKDGGVLKEIKREGTGNESPCEGSTVYVHYVGTLTDGSKFDSSRDRGEKFSFVLGKGRVIKAWDLGVATMKRGEIAVLYCQSPYAYGESGSPPKIPPNATLVFEVELFDWKLEDISKKKDGSVLRQTLKTGESYSSPNDGAQVDIRLVGKLGDRVFDEREVSFAIGEGVDMDIPEGVEQALLKFKKHEISLLTLQPSSAFGTKGQDLFGVPPNATVQYEVELKNFEKAKESWSMDADEKLEQSKICKDKGTNYFKAGKYSMAARQYAKVIEYLELEKSLKEVKAEERTNLMLASYLNQAMCALKMNDFVQAREHCNRALELDAKNEKGLFRRGQALLGLREPALAKKDFEAIVTFDPNNKAAINQLTICNAKIREQNQRDKKLYASIFQKMAAEDKEKGGWRYGWWDDDQKELQYDVNLEEVEREKQQAIEEARAARRKEIQETTKKWKKQKELKAAIEAEEHRANDLAVSQTVEDKQEGVTEAINERLQTPPPAETTGSNDSNKYSTTPVIESSEVSPANDSSAETRKEKNGVGTSGRPGRPAVH